MGFQKHPSHAKHEQAEYHRERGKQEFLARHRRLFAHPSDIRMLTSTVLCRAVFTPVRSGGRKLIEARCHPLALRAPVRQQNQCPVRILAH